MNRIFAAFALPYILVTLLLGGISILAGEPFMTANGIQMLIAAAMTGLLLIQHFRAIAKATGK